MPGCCLDHGRVPVTHAGPMEYLVSSVPSVSLEQPCECVHECVHECMC